MREYSKEMNQRALEAKEQAMREAQAATMGIPNMSSIPATTSISPMPDISSSSSSSTSPSSIPRRVDPAVSIDDEEGKRSLITNEIQMFRDRFKDEDTKMRNTEKERKDRYERERALQREKRATEETPATGNNKSSVSPPPSRDRSSPRHERSSTNRRDRSSPSDDRYRSSSSRNNTSNSVRSRTSDRRNSPPSRYDRRSPVSRSYNHRSRTKSPITKSHLNDEDDEEVYERKRQEKRLREKEVRYRDVSILYC
jgi:RNA-binding protein 25